MILNKKNTNSYVTLQDVLEDISKKYNINDIEDAFILTSIYTLAESLNDTKIKEELIAFIHKLADKMEKKPAIF